MLLADILLGGSLLRGALLADTPLRDTPLGVTLTTDRAELIVMLVETITIEVTGDSGIETDTGGAKI